MSKLSLVLFAALIATTMIFNTKEAIALSCVAPEGDQVQRIIDNATSPIWFGSATLLSFNNFSKKGRYRIEETYLTNAPDLLDEVEKVLISNMNLTWGPYQNIKDKSSKFGIGSTNDMYFRFHDDAWMFGGPGGCLFFTDENWMKLKNSKYEIDSKTDEANNAD
jgi:hypothetical protein